MRAEIITGDCLKVMARLESGSVNLVFADPPYNRGIDYGDHYHDSRAENEFKNWCVGWIKACYNVLADNGSLWLLINYRWASILWNEAVDLGFHQHRWLTWYETFGQNSTCEFNYTSRPLLWFTKHRDNFIFNCDAPEIRRPSDRQLKYNDKRAKPEGKLWDDVWGVNPPIPRLAGTHKERIEGFPTQLPLALLRRIVACASNPGDLVCDWFTGSGTTGAACVELGRQFLGVEISPSMPTSQEKGWLESLAD